MGSEWSRYVQSSGELYYSRLLRFTEENQALWLPALGAGEEGDVLEVGCGGGSLCLRLKQLRPGLRVTGLDRDEGHIRFAREKAAETGLDCGFVVGDAMELPFRDESFDLCFSHTVAEHVPHAPFFREQRRVLRPGGRIAVLSVRSRLGLQGGMAGPDPEEQALLDRAWAAVEDPFPRLQVGTFEMEERQFPAELERYGFRQVRVELFTLLPFAPDNGDVSGERALWQIETLRLASLANLDKLRGLAEEALEAAEWARLYALQNARFDRRRRQYLAGEKLWDFSSVTVLAASGVKP